MLVNNLLLKVQKHHDKILSFYQNLCSLSAVYECFDFLHLLSMILLRILTHSFAFYFLASQNM